MAIAFPKLLDGSGLATKFVVCCFQGTEDFVKGVEKDTAGVDEPFLTALCLANKVIDKDVVPFKAIALVLAIWDIEGLLRGQFGCGPGWDVFGGRWSVGNRIQSMRRGFPAALKALVGYIGAGFSGGTKPRRRLRPTHG
jgi:hypothetical protein